MNQNSKEVITWVAFFVRLFIQVIISIIMQLLFAEDFEDTGATPGDVEFPVVTASDPIPVLFGTRFIKAPNVVWYGDIGAYPYEKCS